MWTHARIVIEWYSSICELQPISLFIVTLFALPAAETKAVVLVLVLVSYNTLIYNTSLKQSSNCCLHLWLWLLSMLIFVTLLKVWPPELILVFVLMIVGWITSSSSRLLQLQDMATQIRCLNNPKTSCKHNIFSSLITVWYYSFLYHIINLFGVFSS